MFEVGDFSVTTRISDQGNNSFCVVTIVYGPLEDDDQLLFHKILTRCKPTNSPSHVAGDFNVVSEPPEGSN